MTPTPYVDRDVDELLRLFEEYGLRMHDALYANDDGGQPIGEADMATGLAVLQIATEIHRRGAGAMLEPLLNHPKAGVREKAALAYLGIDYERASVVMNAAKEGCSVAEMTALQQRARTPNRLPELSRLDIEELLQAFTDAGIRAHGASFLEDEDGNPDDQHTARLLREQLQIVNEIKSRDALSALLPLLDHENMGVRSAAAFHCRDLDPQRARQVLTAIADRSNHNWAERDSARFSLDWWQEERRKAMSGTVGT